MLSPQTRAHLLAFTCPHCNKPVAVHHAYPVLDPAGLISRLTEHAPAHLKCVEDYIESNPTESGELVFAIYVVKAGPQTASGKLIRLIKGDPDSTFIQLWSPEAVHFRHITWAEGAEIVRPPAPGHMENWMIPAIEAAYKAATTPEERREIALTLGDLKKRYDKSIRPHLEDSRI